MGEETESNEVTTYPLTTMAKTIQKMARNAVQTQIELLRQTASTQIESTRDILSSVGRFTQFAMFKTVVQSGGRISIPEAEKETVKIEEGDLVQVIVLPIKKVKQTEKE